MNNGDDAVRLRRVTQWRGESSADFEDALVVEEPLEIRVNDERFTVTMRTPGDDFALTRGLLFTEGWIESEADIAQIRYCDTGEAADADTLNIITVRLTRAPATGKLWQRTLMAGTSCGLCGKAALEAVASHVCPLSPSGTISRDVLLQIPHTLRESQSLFQKTGGLHAVGLFTVSGEPLCVYEDIGRHNAADKAIGHGIAAGWLPWKSNEPVVLLVSGRASFEITQKALIAQVPIVCAVSAASSLAAELAHENHQTLIGFLRDTGFTIYAGAERIEQTEPPSSIEKEFIHSNQSE